MATSSVTTLEFQGSGSFIVKAISGVSSLLKRIVGSETHEEAAAARPALGDEHAPGGSRASAVLLEGMSTQQGGADAGCVQVWHQTGMTYDHEPNNFRSRHVNVSLPARVTAQNGTAFLHVWAAASGHSPSPISPSFTRSGAVHIVHPLVKYMPKRKQQKLMSLMGGDEAGGSDASAEPGATPHPDARDLWKDPFGWNTPAEEAEVGDPEAPAPDAVEDFDAEFAGGDVEDEGEGAAEVADAPIVAYWKPAAAISMIPDWSAQKIGAIAPFVIDVLQGDPDATPPVYLPHLYVNDFWLLQNDLIELNGTLESVPLHLTFNPTSLWKFSLQAQMTASWSAQSSWGMTGGGDASSAGAENDMLKKMMLDTNPILLGITLTVSLLHTLFDFLAFKNDISFWRNTKTMEGLSLRTVGMNVFFQVVILLYLWDNETSWMILGSSVMGLGIEVWKLKKAMSVGISWPAGSALPVVQWETKDDAYVRSKTKMYDDMAMSHLSVLVFPLVLGYALYSLLYGVHKSWFSWVITSLTGFVYAFGFILMTPQLFINYKLKSVAALPWRGLTYKFLNTIVDDLFAFVIDMPVMHRLSVFRDDIVFLVYLYQRWAYRVDVSRANEYGRSGEDYEAAQLRAEGKLRTAKRSKWELTDGRRGKTAPAAPAALADADAAEAGSPTESK